MIFQKKHEKWFDINIFDQDKYWNILHFSYIFIKLNIFNKEKYYFNSIEYIESWF